MLKYFIVATLSYGFFWFAMVLIAMMGGGPGATMKRDFWIFAGSFIAVPLIIGLACFFWFYKSDLYFALFILASCLITSGYLASDYKKDFSLFLSATDGVHQDKSGVEVQAP